MCNSGNVQGALTGGAIGGIGGALMGGAMGGDTPDVPGLSAEERDLLQKQGVTLDQMNQILSGERSQIEQNRSLLQQFSGLYNSDGSINDQAVSSLRGKIMETQALQEGISIDALKYLKGIFQPTAYQQQSNQVAQQELDRYQNALTGNIPLTAAQKQQEQKQFELLKEQAGQRGIKIDGNDIFSATSESTAGNQLLSNLRQDTNVQRQQLSESELSRGYAANTGRLGLGLSQQGQLAGIAQSNITQPGSSQLNFLQNSFSQTPASLLSGYSNLSSQYQSSLDPYQSQRYLGFQNSLAQYGAQQQMYSDLLGLGGKLGAAAITKGA